MKQVVSQHIAVIGRGPTPGRRQTAAALASTNELAGRATRLGLTHGETLQLVSRETKPDSPADIFGVVDEGGESANTLLVRAARIVISLADAPDLQETAASMGQHLTGNLGINTQKLLVIVHGSEMNGASVKRLQSVEALGFGRHPFCISHLSDGYHDILKKGILDLGRLGTEPSIANLVEVWTELRL